MVVTGLHYFPCWIRFILIVCICLSAVGKPVQGQISLYYNSDYIQIEEGNIFAEGSNLKGTLDQLNLEVQLIQDFSRENILNSELIIIPEIEKKNLVNDLSQDQISNLSNYVKNGGGLIICGVVSPNESNQNNAIDFLNDVYDFNLVSDEVALTGRSNKSTLSTQSEFNDCPNQITNNNSIAFITGGLPSNSKVLYSDTEDQSNVSVAILEYGLGKIAYLGWGWWNSLPAGAQDGGWFSILSASIELLHCEKPQIDPIQNLKIDLGSNRKIEFSAADLNTNFFVCTEGSTISLSQSVFDCSNLGMNEIDLILKDDIGREITEKFWIEISDENDYCNSSTSFSDLEGKIYTVLGRPINEVILKLSGENNYEDITDEAGTFHMPEIPVNNSSFLSAQKSTLVLNGVTTYDMVLISKHINEIEHLASPYKYIAADINNSGDISIADLVELRRLILFQQTRFTNQDSWQFIKIGMDLSNPLSPEVDAPVQIEFQDGKTDVNFVGVKIGDINFNVDPMLRSFSSKEIEVQDVKFVANEVIKIPMYFRQNDNLEGLQLGLEYDTENLEFLAVESASLEMSQANYNIIDNEIYISCLNEKQDLPKGETPLFYLKFKTKKAGLFSNQIRIIKEKFQSEIYLDDLSLYNLDLSFDDLEMKSASQEISNYPNPFREFTEISFQLDLDSEVILEVHSLDGQLVYEMKKHFNAGNQKVRLEQANFKKSGIYYYTITIGGIQKTNTMIKM